MSTETLIVLGGSLILAVGGWVIMPKYWRGQRAEQYEYGFAVWAILGDGVRRGVVRALLPALIGCDFAVLFYGLGKWAETATGSVREVTDTLAAGCAIAALVMMVSFLGVILFNRPKFMVPPYLRHERGALMPGRSSTVNSDD